MPATGTRIHRYVSWQFAVIVVVLTASFGGALAQVLGEEAIAAATKAPFLILVYVVLVAFPVLSLRRRTVVDDEAVTQHWITSSYRIPLDEITGIERDGDYYRWFLRVRAGERTFEVIPCYVFRRPGGVFSPGPPRALLAAEDDIRRRIESL
ncbi:hypothetical protein [Actinoplanes sp. NPDC020271]|uniref:hypothetical protein n=1 Tax=Actinoplanes sp. NPDC020271 TaxID=3363896 RepID=UPI00379C4018